MNDLCQHHHIQGSNQLAEDHF